MPPARDDRARTVFNTPGLVVTGASAEHMLAMKIDAARNSDEDDIGVLVEIRPRGGRRPPARFRGFRWGCRREVLQPDPPEHI